MLLGVTSTETHAYTYGAITLYGTAFQPTSTSRVFSYSAQARQHLQDGPTTPQLQPLPGITQKWFGLIRFRSPLLSESLLFSLPAGTEMFHFPTFPPHTLYIQARVPRHDSRWVSPFGHPRITGRLPPPQGLSQAPTSFIGSWCQGIHHVPLKACPSNVKTQQRTPEHAQRPHTNPQPQQQRLRVECLYSTKNKYCNTHKTNTHQQKPACIHSCSRPLSRSQTTTPPTPNHTTTCAVRQRRERNNNHQTPTRGSRLDASDTQQHARKPNPTISFEGSTTTQRATSTDQTKQPSQIHHRRFH